MLRAPTVEFIPTADDQSFALSHATRARGWLFSWHRHPEWELTSIVRGQGVRFVADSVEDFGPGDLCLIPPDLPHTWMSRPAGEPGESLVLQVPAAVLTRAAALPEGGALRRLLARSSGGLRFTAPAVRQDAARRLADLAGESGLGRYAGLLALLDDLSRADAAPLAHHPTLASGRLDQRLARVLERVETHLSDGLSQKRAAALVGMTPSSFSRYFRLATGSTFADHLGRRRIAAVCRDLIETDDRVLDIALRWGWQGMAAFNRRFKSIQGCTPSAWRRRRLPG